MRDTLTQQIAADFDRLDRAWDKLFIAINSGGDLQTAREEFEQEVDAVTTERRERVKRDTRAMTASVTDGRSPCV